MLLTPDLCVIGGGSGGLSVAAAAAAFGVPVVLVEKGRMGGDCLNYGCVPSKALLAAAKRADTLRKAVPFGISLPRPSVDYAVEFAKVHAHVHRVIAAIAPNDSRERFTGLGVQVIEGVARFTDRRTVAVGDEIEIKARRFVIATGSTPSAPPIPGLAEAKYLTNETIFDLTKCPAHLVVIGAGPVGLEMAQALRRLGAEVTVIEAAEPLAREEPECAAILLDRLRDEGIRIIPRAKIVQVLAGEPIRVVTEGPDGRAAVDGSHILVAAGRRPNVEGLGLEAAGVKVDQKGIVVDKRLKTSNRKVYAIGDVAGGLQFTHVANFHAGLVIRNALFGLPVSTKNAAIPWVTFTDPELAQVGLTETEARQRHRRIQVLRWPYHENDRAQAERETHGHIKVVTARSGRILGVTIVGAHAGELIVTWTLAISQRLKVGAFLGIIIPYPTLSEIGKRAAISFFTPNLTSPLLRRIMTFVRRFG
jgi:pyruvate/2-oxoglutarate dehydrogenase complex dihydrolipoamide dehydrogenase (E3) component